MKSALLILSLAAFAWGCFFAGHERAAALRAEADLAGARQAREALDASIRGRAKSGAFSSPRSQPAAPAVADDGAASSPAAASGPAASSMDPARAKLRESYLKSYRDGLDATMALLFARLRLTPAQADALKDLLARREANNLRIADLTQAAGLEDSSQDPALDGLDEQLSRQNKEAIAGLIGRPGERQVNAFLKQTNVMPALDMIGADAAAGGEPLSLDQQLGVLDLLTGASQKSGSGRVIKGTVDWDQVQAQASKVLSPAQQSVLQRVRADFEAQDGVRRMVVALNGQAAGLGP